MVNTYLLLSLRYSLTQLLSVRRGVPKAFEFVIPFYMAAFSDLAEFLGFLLIG